MSVEIDWWRFRSSWSRIKRVRGAMVKTTIFDEILMWALCSINSSNLSHPRSQPPIIEHKRGFQDILCSDVSRINAIRC
jgi:hypothetical protein